jgi:hypothetical protein
MLFPFYSTRGPRVPLHCVLCVHDTYLHYHTDVLPHKQFNLTSSCVLTTFHTLKRELLTSLSSLPQPNNTFRTTPPHLSLACDLHGPN